MISKAKFVQVVTIKDPDTKGQVELSIYKHENGGMFAMDSSYMEQLDGIGDEDDITCRIPDPFGDNEHMTLVELHED
ncbi:MAG: hypothetical protein WC333_02045 [Dehalococcoidia bacterium]